ncbi:restriction endonuclease [Halorubrum kocurii JCM 14978]|uniref:Restriction endonuclease n=1 Tax=Halorubrum kocurii JCM 14978 TaxID=1230456 RepID=M0P8C8_9EURY|nr:restriction endonuclease [Halorubrum kocurii JCM 14978]
MDDLSGFEFEDVMEGVFRNLVDENVGSADRPLPLAPRHRRDAETPRSASTP